MASTAARATRSSNSQLPPDTPIPPTHSPSTMIGYPPSIAVQRSGRPFVRRGADGFRGRRMDGVETAAIHPFEENEMSSGIGNGDGNGDALALGHADRGLHHLLGTGQRETVRGSNKRGLIHRDLGL